jgi:hypothetical protein
MTGTLIDNSRIVWLSRLQQRLMEGLIQGLVMAGVSYLVHCWLLERVQQVSAVPTGYRVPDLDHVMIMAGIIGFVLGFCIPTWCREAPRSRPELREPENPINLLPSQPASPLASI